MRPKYISGHGTLSLDGQCLMVIAAIHYSFRANDHEFLKAHWDALVKAIAWTEKSVLENKDDLLTQGAFADRADSIALSGHALYTNVIYWKALQEMSEAATHFELQDQTSLYAQKAQRVGKAIQDHLWRPTWDISPQAICSINSPAVEIYLQLHGGWQLPNRQIPSWMH